MDNSEVGKEGRGARGADVPLLDPAGGGARAAAERLRRRLRLLRGRVVVVSPGARRRVLHAAGDASCPPLPPSALRDAAAGAVE